MKVIEVRFDDNVQMPGTPRRTTTIRTTENNHIGNPVKVDDLQERPEGILATNIVENDGKLVTHRKLYPWTGILEVSYEPEVEPQKPRPEVKKA